MPYIFFFLHINFRFVFSSFFVLSLDFLVAYCSVRKTTWCGCHFSDKCKFVIFSMPNKQKRTYIQRRRMEEEKMTRFPNEFIKEVQIFYYFLFVFYFLIKEFEAFRSGFELNPSHMNMMNRFWFYVVQNQWIIKINLRGNEWQIISKGVISMYIPMISYNKQQQVDRDAISIYLYFSSLMFFYFVVCLCYF